MAKNYLKRYLWFVIGIAINSLGIALITKAALGTSPISSVSYVLSLYFPLTLGQFTFLVNLIFILAQVVILKKDFALIQFLQIAVNIVFSVCIDASMTLLNWFSPNQLGSELLCLVIGCIVLGLGICIEARFGRVAPFITCTKRAGGSPLRFLAASNFHPRSEPGREACNPKRTSGVPKK